MWLDYPDNKPKSTGYYYTYYFNHEYDRHFYKAFFWSKNSKWEFRFNPDVIAFIEESRNDYYIPCMEWSSNEWRNGKNILSYPEYKAANN